MMNDNYKAVSRFVFDPATSMFKWPANEHATCQTIFCKLGSCPLRDLGTCMLSIPLFPVRCPYGRMQRETGPTRRARSYSKWVREHKAEYPDVGRLSSPANKIVFIGEYVYLPYAHMTMCEEVPFLAHSAIFVSGRCLLPKDAWTTEVVLKLVDFRPRAMMGGEIKTYQKDVVPLFLLHLRRADTAMWTATISIRPALDVEPNYVGRKALLKTLNAPIEWSTGHDKYPVQWKWDGEKLTTHSPIVYSSIWGKVKVKEMCLTCVPEDDTDIVVQDNNWVTDSTVFTT